MQLTWLGHACVLLTGSKKILIDPFIEGGSVLDTDPDIVAVTHGHGDHLGETVALGKKNHRHYRDCKVPHVEGPACREFEHRGNRDC